jgi:NAD(P)H-nitrite reductase large subunit
MVIIVAGARPNFVLAQSAGIATDNGVLVKNTLETSHYRIFACGDVASSGPKFRGSATIASEQGTIAGANVCSSILGLPLQYYTPRSVQVFMKYGNFEIRCGGVVPSENDEIEILTEEEEKFRALFKKGKEIVGIQMVGTSDEFGRYFKSLKNPE